MSNLIIDCCTFGYIGPGAGIALLGPLMAVGAAVLGSIGMISLAPLRWFLNRRKSSSLEN